MFMDYLTAKPPGGDPWSQKNPQGGGLLGKIAGAWNPSAAMQNPLLHMGLGILANNTGNYGSGMAALGQGGLAGMQSYQNVMNSEAARKQAQAQESREQSSFEAQSEAAKRQRQAQIDIAKAMQAGASPQQLQATYARYNPQIAAQMFEGGQDRAAQETRDIRGMSQDAAMQKQELDARAQLSEKGMSQDAAMQKQRIDSEGALLEKRAELERKAEMDRRAFEMKQLSAQGVKYVPATEADKASIGLDPMQPAQVDVKTGKITPVSSIPEGPRQAAAADDALGKIDSLLDSDVVKSWHSTVTSPVEWQKAEATFRELAVASAKLDNPGRAPTDADVKIAMDNLPKQGEKPSVRKHKLDLLRQKFSAARPGKRRTIDMGGGITVHEGGF